MREPVNLIELIGRAKLISQHPEWNAMRDWYVAQPYRWNTWRIMHWYRVQP